MTSAPALDCPFPESGFDCDFQRRFAAAQAYVDARPGSTALVVRDRDGDVVWRNEHAGDMVWTASTIKLAMAADLLVRDRAGEIALSAADRAAMDAMLFDSDDKAATELWMRYSGPDHTAFNDHFPGLGLVSLRPQPGYGRVYPYWGFQKTTADDLDRLLQHVLGSLDPRTGRTWSTGCARSPPRSSGACGAPARRPSRATRTAGPTRTAAGSCTPSASSARTSASPPSSSTTCAARAGTRRARRPPPKPPGCFSPAASRPPASRLMPSHTRRWAGGPTAVRRRGRRVRAGWTSR
ncbi:hypothetical protein ACFQV2_09485 [Actinokineospora soli]|uniref:Beta-lactamase enzyme family protein n=1 Tax=Actinokineospora soli TaxID=1048753 RepID=A0ABW2TJ66_9PSEU